MVTDFGLAKRVESDKGLTQSGAIVGTPSYMPPEQAAGGKDISTAADVYSLGAVLYELLTGRPPFKGASPLETLLQVMEREPQRPRALNSLIDRDLETICMKCLEKEPGKRYDSAEALAEDGERWLAGVPIRARRAGRWERVVKWAKRRPAVAALVGALVLVSLVSLVAGGWMGVRTVRALREAQWQVYVTSVTLARRELDERNYEQADARLGACLPHLRHWEWHYLDRECHPEQRLVKANMGGLSGVAWSRDGRTIAVASSSARLALIDAETGQWLRGPSGPRILEGPKGSSGWMKAVTFDAAGRSVAAARDKEVLVWDLASDALAHTLRGHTAKVNGIAFSPDGRLLASAGSDHTVRLWDLGSGGLLHTFSGHGGAVNGVAFRPDGRHLASAGDDGLKVWDVAGRRLVNHHDQNLPPCALAYSPDGRTLAVLTWDGILLYDTETAATVPIAAGHQLHRFVGFDVTYGLAFSPDGAWLVSTDPMDLKAIVWDVAGRRPVAVWRGHTGPVSGVAFDPQGGRFVTASWDTTLRFWDVSARPAPVQLGGLPKGFISAVACSAEGRFFATGYTTGTVKLWEAVSGKELRSWDASTIHVISLAFSPDGRLLATGSGAGLDPSFRAAELRAEAKVWDVQTGQLRFSLDGQSYLVRASFSPDGQRLVVASGGQDVQVYDSASGQLLEKLAVDRHTPGGPAAEVWSAAFSPDGRLLAATEYWGARVTLWDTGTGAVRRQLGDDTTSRSCLSRVVFSPDGRYLADQTASGITVWDVRTGSQVSRLDKPPDCWDFAFSPDGRRLVTAGKRLQAWDTASGAEVLRLPPEIAYAVTFSPDGRRLLSGNASVLLIRDGTPRP